MHHAWHRDSSPPSLRPARASSAGARMPGYAYLILNIARGQTRPLGRRVVDTRFGRRFYDYLLSSGDDYPLIYILESLTEALQVVEQVRPFSIEDRSTQMHS